MTLHKRLPAGKYALSVDDYVMLADAGVFGEEKTELIDGDVIVMAPEYRPHAYVRDELAYRIRRALEAIGSDIFVGSGSVLLSHNMMPQPDIVLTREPRGDGPIPLNSVTLLIEVSSTTLPSDLGRKREIYATASVDEYWVVDVNGRTIYQMWSPADGIYREETTIEFGETITLATIAGIYIDTSSL